MSRCSCGKGFSTEKSLEQHIESSDATHMHPALVLSANMLRLDGAMVTVDLRPTSDELVVILGDALQKAEEHLEYCGYGDTWERECAEGLSEHIEIALTAYKEHLE